MSTDTIFFCLPGKPFKRKWYFGDQCWEDYRKQRDFWSKTLYLTWFYVRLRATYVRGHRFVLNSSPKLRKRPKKGLVGGQRKRTPELTSKLAWARGEFKTREFKRGFTLLINSTSQFHRSSCLTALHHETGKWESRTGDGDLALVAVFTFQTPKEQKTQQSWS